MINRNFRLLFSDYHYVSRMAIVNLLPFWNVYCASFPPNDRKFARKWLDADAALLEGHFSWLERVCHCKWKAITLRVLDHIELSIVCPVTRVQMLWASLIPLDYIISLRIIYVSLISRNIIIHKSPRFMITKITIKLPLFVQCVVLGSIMPLSLMIAQSITFGPSTAK